MGAGREAGQGVAERSEGGEQGPEAWGQRGRRQERGVSRAGASGDF